MSREWDADVELSREAAARLIVRQFPALAPARLALLGAGWDNTAYLVNERFVFRFPRRRDPVTLCALTAAVLIALQIALGHWFYLYIVWWLAPFWVALLVGAGASPPAPRTIRGRDRP